MSIDFPAFDHAHLPGEFAAHPLARLAARLSLSLVVAGPGLPSPRFVAGTWPDAPSSVPNYGFQDYPAHLRRICFKDPESDKLLVFLANNFALPAATI